MQSLIWLGLIACLIFAVWALLPDPDPDEDRPWSDFFA